MSIQYSISYDETGSPSLVKNTIEGPKQVVRTSFNIGKFEPTRTRTISDFANVSSFDDIKAERGTEQVTKSLQKYIYQQETNRDDDPEQTASFSQQSFEAAAVRGPDGKVIGGLTFKEKAKMAAFQYSQRPALGLVVDTFTPFGAIGSLVSRYGKAQLLDEYNPNSPTYYTEGFGQYISKQDRPSLTSAQQIDKLQKMGIDSGTRIKDPSDYLQEQAAKERQKELADIQNEIGRALHGGGNGGNGGNNDSGGGATGRDAGMGMGGKQR